VLREEALQIFGSGKTGTFHDIFQDGLSKRAPGWNVFFLVMGAEHLPSNEEMAPKTAALLHKLRIDGLETAFFSFLAGNQYIRPHFGYWRGITRYHLGLQVPDNGQATLYVKDVEKTPDLNYTGSLFAGDAEEYHYREGQGVIWDDTNLHAVRNDAETPRIVLWLDLQCRDMPWYLRLFNRIALLIANRDSYIARRRARAVIKPGEEDSLPDHETH
jgi:beta-hydroxylase